MACALKTLNIQRVKFGEVAVAHNDTDGVELNHWLQRGVQSSKDVRQFEVRANGLRHLENDRRVQATLRERHRTGHKCLGPYLPLVEYTCLVARDDAQH